VNRIGARIKKPEVAKIVAFKYTEFAIENYTIAANHLLFGDEP
jgi:hypothetical protein